MEPMGSQLMSSMCTESETSPQMVPNLKAESTTVSGTKRAKHSTSADRLSDRGFGFVVLNAESPEPRYSVRSC